MRWRSMVFAPCRKAAGRSFEIRWPIGGQVLPWSDQRAFAELMLSWEIRSYRAALTLSAIFDRAVPDVLGYLRLSDLPIPSHVERAAQTFRYHRRVFIAPPWPEIFARDAERKQSFQEAQMTYEVMTETYTGLGYDLIPLPRNPQNSN
jgi:predicted ATPase